MVSVIAPNTDFPAHKISVFLAGTITGAKKDWQKQITESLKSYDIVVFNPRREKKPEDEEGIREQIEWEQENLRRADLISFWFSEETVAPITLYEYGFWSASKKPIVVGVHPKYPRKFDVEVQTKRARPDIKIVYSLEDLSIGISEEILAAISR
jgi:nucleoside 2-deoxyribosyltransferase